mmetsp:Transcript_66151/g.123447  ORF Transcript_66151/g.123447 Transcript_66151/m.123447 type:complete len:587 (+) Transcript_66151:48-1808(+)
MPWVPVYAAAPTKSSTRGLQENPPAAECLHVLRGPSSCNESPSCSVEEASSASTGLPLQSDRSSLPASSSSQKAKACGGRRRWADIGSDSDSEVVDLFASPTDEDVATSSDAPTEACAALSDRSWAAELLSLSARLRHLAAQAPPMAHSCPNVRDAGTLTDDMPSNSLDLIPSAATMQDDLRRASALVQNLKRQVEMAQERAAAGEVCLLQLRGNAERQKLRSAAASSALSRACAAEQEIHASSCSWIAQLATEEVSLRGVLAEKKEQELERRRSTAQSLTALQAAIAEEGVRAVGVEEEAAQAKDACKDAEGMPELKARMEEDRRRLSKHEDEQSQLGKVLATLHAERDALMNGAGAKVEVLEQRAAQLEKDCQEMSGPAGEGAPAGAENAETELAIAKDHNRGLLIKVKEARVKRDTAEAELASITAEVQKTLLQCVHAEESARYQSQELCEVRQRTTDAQRDVVLLNHRDSELTDRIDDLQRQYDGLCSRQEEVEQRTKKVQEVRRKIEEGIPLIEFKLNHLKTQTRDKAPKSLPQPSHARAHVLPSIEMRKNAFAKCGQSIGSDFGDAESTTAGESAADSLP